jgi:hypothetical protein
MIQYAGRIIGHVFCPPKGMLEFTLCLAKLAQTTQGQGQPSAGRCVPLMQTKDSTELSGCLRKFPQADKKASISKQRAYVSKLLRYNGFIPSPGILQGFLVKKLDVPPIARHLTNTTTLLPAKRLPKSPPVLLNGIKWLSAVT